MGSQDNSAIHEPCGDPLPFLISKLRGWGGGAGAKAVVPLLYYIPLYKAQKHNVEWKGKVNSRQ